MAAGETYEEFVEKFKPRRTTDDCLTPPAIYDAVAAYVERHYSLDRGRFVRPFWPGGDYERFNYPEGAVVVDNPPFSMLARIIRFYAARDINYFLFSNGLTALSGAALECGAVIFPGLSLTYENGARVNTAFATNLEPARRVRSAGDLRAALLAVQPRKSRAKRPRPTGIYTSADLQTLARHDDFCFDGVARYKSKELYGGAIHVAEV